MRYLKTILIALFLVGAIGLGVAWGDPPDPPKPQPQQQVQVQTPAAPAPTQRMPATPPGMDMNARPYLPPAIMDTVVRPGAAKVKPEKVNLPLPGVVPAGPPTSSRALSPEDKKLLQAEMTSLRQWLQGEQARLGQQRTQALQEIAAKTAARRQELSRELRAVVRQWEAAKQLRQPPPAQVANFQERLVRLSSRVREMNEAQNRELQALNQQSAALTQTYLQRQEDIINKYYRQENLTGAPLADFAMTHFQ